MASATSHPVTISPDQALAVAHADALAAYRDLSPFRIEIVQSDQGWKIDYEIQNPATKGGGPHYIIDVETGEIVSKRYEQ
jgi:hypothetical protein